MDGHVVITGASGQVGTVLQRRLADLGRGFRAVGRHDDLATALGAARAVVHLAGTLRPVKPNSYREANLETVRRTIAALEGSAVERLVFLSYVGSSPRSQNEYLRTKGEAEQLLLASGREVVIFRCTHIYGPPPEPGPTVSAFRAKNDGRVTILGDGKQRVAPVYREDVVDAAVRALEPRAPTGTFDLAGPEVMSLDEFVRTVNGDEARLRHTPSPVARVLGRLVPALTPALVDILLADSVARPDTAGNPFPLPAHRPRDVYARVGSGDPKGGGR